MISHRSISYFLIIFVAFGSSVCSQPAASTKLNILFVPLDDRPPCLQFTEKMALIADANLKSPPLELLGKFTIPGSSEKIIDWMSSLDLSNYEAAIISLDMLAFGGLVGSRVHEVDVKQAADRVNQIQALRKKYPKLKIYAQSVIMRLAPTADGKNESYRASLAKWAEVSVIDNEQAKAETRKLESIIPAEGLNNYKQARERNLRINLQAIEYVKSGILDYLVLSQDDAKPVGVHVSDRVKLQQEIQRFGLADRVAVQPGADEVSMLLLSRAVNKYYNIAPRVKAVYSSAVAANTVMPFEDKPLKETVSYHIKATGSDEVQNANEADILFYVFASRNDTGRAKSFAAEIEQEVLAGKKLILADIDPVGDVQGGDSTFTRELMKRNVFAELNGYAAWNTAANTIGTALPHGIVFNAAEKKLLGHEAVASRVWTAQNWFTFHRILDDYYFHGMNRLQVNRFFEQNKLSSKILTDSGNKKVEEYGKTLMQQSFDELSANYFTRINGSRQAKVRCEQPHDLHFSLPWNRTFEALIDFNLRCSAN